jgi:undecaprenyl diphosphate synthase
MSTGLEAMRFSRVLGQMKPAAVSSEPSMALRTEAHQRERAIQMVDAIKWCMELGVTTISVYAFSIENFKRNEDEVAFLMKLSQEKFGELMQVRTGAPIHL